MEWILHPLTHYTLTALGFALCLYLFLTLKRELRAVEGRNVEQRQSLDESLGALQTGLGRIRSELGELQEYAGMLVPPAPPASGLNLNKRALALHMHRRGEDPQQIAASLSLPQAEVDLLLKVQKIQMESSERNGD
jgi:hypothetical protein